MKLRHRSGRGKARGVSLVEMMVGLVIGMVAILVVMQVFALSESAKRTTTGGDDAQTNGAIALATLQREIRQAGYGFTSFTMIGCNVAMPPPAAWTITPAAPVTVNPAGIPAGDANTDTLMVVYGNHDGSSEGDRVITQPAGTPTVYTVTTPSAFAIGDFVVAVPLTNPRPDPCVLNIERVANVTASPPNVTVPVGLAGMINGTLFNMGRRPQVRVYAVRGGSLTACDYVTSNCGAAGSVADPTVWVPINDNVVSLRAEYGRDTTPPPMDAVIDTYDQATPAGTSACGWSRVSAIRLAVVTRNSQMDRDTVTTAAPTWAGSASTPIDLSANGNWQFFRYKSFETIVPIRNMAWQGAQAC